MAVVSELAPWAGNKIVSPGETLWEMDAESATRESLLGKDKLGVQLPGQSLEPPGSPVPHRPKSTFGLRNKSPVLGRSLSQSKLNNVLLKDEFVVRKGQSASGIKQGSALSLRKSLRVPKVWLTLMTTIIKRVDFFCASSSGNAKCDCRARARTECRNAVLGSITEDAATLALRRHAERKLQKLNEAVLTRVSLLPLRSNASSQEKVLRCEWTPEIAVAAPSSDLAYLSAHLQVLDALSAVDFEAVARAGDLKKLAFKLRTELNKERNTMESLQRTYIRQVKKSDFLATMVDTTKNEHEALLVEIDNLKSQLLMEKKRQQQQTASSKDIEEGVCSLIQSLRNDKKRLEDRTRNALSTADVMAASLSSAHTEHDRLRLLNERTDAKVKKAHIRVDMAEKALLHDDEHLKELESTLIDLSNARVQIEALTMQKVKDEANIVLERQLRKKAEIRANKYTRDYTDAQAHAEWEARKAEKFKDEMIALRHELLLAKRKLNARKVIKKNSNIADDLDKVLNEEMANVSKRLMTKLAQVSEGADSMSAKHREEIVYVQRHAHNAYAGSDVRKPMMGGRVDKQSNYVTESAPNVVSPRQPIHTAALSSEVEAEKGSERTAKNWAVRQMILDETEPVTKSKIKWDFRARQSQLPSKDHFNNLPCTKPRVLMPKIGKIVDSSSLETDVCGLTFEVDEIEEGDVTSATTFKSLI